MRRRILLIFLSALLLSGCTLPGFLQKKYAAIQITTNTKAEVFLDTEKVGETPFTSEKLKSQDYSIKLVPQDTNFAEWETTVTLQPNITTVINFNFGKDRQNSSGIILSLAETVNQESAEIVIISMPDNASIKIDGQPKGFTPLQVKNVAAGAHTLVASAPGYKQLQTEIKTVEGYKLTADIQLAKESIVDQESTSSAETTEVVDEEKDKDEVEKKEETSTTPETSKPASPSAEIELPYIEVLDTPTGWLRVRSNPTTAEDNEIAKIKPGEKYPYLNSNDTGWHQIKVSGEEGWVSGRYAKVYK